MFASIILVVQTNCSQKFTYVEYTPTNLRYHSVVTKFFKNLVYRVWVKDALRKLGHMRPHIRRSDMILELGSGPGSLWQVLSEDGFTVQGLDVAPRNVRREYMPRLYDGRSIPYPDHAFDVVILATVLHHCPNPEAVLFEASRVGKRVMVIEDVPWGRWHMPILKATDAMVNGEFQGHPFNFRSHLQWRRTFKKLRLDCHKVTFFPVTPFFRQALFVLDSRR